MPIPVPSQELFSRDIVLGLQQKGSRLRTKCQINYFNEGVKAEMFKRLGTTEAEDADGRNDDTPVMSTPKDHRWVKPRPFHWGDLFEERDILESIGDPSSPIIQNATYAMGRKLDRGRIIPSLYADAMVGDHGESTVPFPADGSQDVAATVGSAGGATATVMNVSKFIAAYGTLMENEIDLETETLNCAMSGKAVAQLMEDERFTSKLYRDSAVFDNRGILQAFLGFNITYLKGLPIDVNNIEACPFWASSGMGLGIWMDMKTKMGEDSGKQFKTRVYLKMHAGATRLDEQKLVRVYAKRP